MRVYIVEDNASHLELLQLKVESLGYEVVGASQTAMNALLPIQEKTPDVVLLDINLNGSNDGIALAHQINKFTDVPIIFITSQSKNDIVADAIVAQPSGYLIKPVDPNELKANIELAVHKKKEPQVTATKKEDFLSVRTGDKLQMLPFKSIKFLKVETKNYVTLIDDKDKQFVIRDSLKNVLQVLLPDDFIRTHHSYGVNLEYVSFIDEREQVMHLKTNDTVPIGKSFRKIVYEKMNIKS